MKKSVSKEWRRCPACGRFYTNGEAFCLNDRYPTRPSSEEEYKAGFKGLQDNAVKAKAEREKEEPSKPDIKSANVPRCPTCGSDEVEKISVGNRTAHALIFGFLLSKTARSQFKCKNCGYMW